MYIKIINAEVLRTILNVSLISLDTTSNDRMKKRIIFLVGYNLKNIKNINSIAPTHNSGYILIANIERKIDTMNIFLLLVTVL